MTVSLRSPWAWLPPAIALALVAGILGTGANRTLFLWLNRGGQAVGDLVWFHLTMLGDGAVALALVLPLIRRAPHLFWAALLAAVVAGLWTDTYLLWAGLLVTVLVPAGVVLFPGIFWIWMAVCGGGTLIATGFYVRHGWRSRDA